MHIALCDDENYDLQMLHNLLAQYDQKSHLKVSCYTSAASLLKDAANTSFDIAILDIEMAAPNGYEAALELRKQPTPPLIIFVTNSMAYTIKGYGVAFRYIPKPVTLDDLSAALDAAIREIHANSFSFSVDGTDYILQMQELYYFEVFNHVTILHTLDCEYSLRASLKEVLSQLPQGYFGMPHQSYIVNFTHIKTVGAHELTLTNGARIPVSRRRQSDFTRQLHSYLGR